MKNQSDKFRAWVAQEGDKGLKEFDLSYLRSGDTLIRVMYSSINYKDALSILNVKNIARAPGIIAGVDLAGEVVYSESEELNPGDKVIATGCGLGESIHGGFSEYARLNSDILIKVPSNLSLRTAMILGTAGLTAQALVSSLEHYGLSNEASKVFVTGPSGGVGSISMHLISRRSVFVSAISSRAKENQDLLFLNGASEVLDSSEFMDLSKKNLGSVTFCGGIDVVGGQLLGNLLKLVGYEGSVVATGLSGGDQLITTVYPFIIRAVKLIGVETVLMDKNKKQELWKALIRGCEKEFCDRLLAYEIRLDEIPQYAKMLIDKKISGRVLVDILNS